MRHLGEQPDVGVCLDFGQIGRWDIFDGLHVTSQQRRQTGGTIRDKAHGHFRPGWFFAPVAVVAFEFQPVVALKFNVLVATRTDHPLAAGEIVAGHAGRRFFGNDVDRGQVSQHQRVGLFGGEADGVGVDDFLVDDGLGVDIKLAWAADDGGRAVHGPSDVFGCHLAAVVKLDALAQLEFPGQVVDQGPGFGQRGRDMTVGVHGDQCFEHVVRHIQIGKQVVKMRVQRRRRRAHGQLEFLRGNQGCGDGEQGGEREPKQAFFAQF